MLDPVMLPLSIENILIDKNGSFFYVLKEMRCINHMFLI